MKHTSYFDHVLTVGKREKETGKEKRRERSKKTRKEKKRKKRENAGTEA